MAYLGARKRTTRQASSQAVNRRRSEGGPRAWFASIDWNSVRFRTVAVLFFVVWGALWVRAGYVQLWEGPFLAERARRQHMAAETVAMPRGMITDRNGHILARSVECCSVYANPSIITDIEATATTLAGVLGRPVDQIKPLLEKKRSFVWIARRVDDATAEAIRQADLTGVELSREFERIYPYRQVAGQLLGFVGMDGKGLEGIERSFDEQLGGLSVRQAVRRDASGREFYVNSNYEAQPAEDVHLTLDLQVQSIAEEEISKAVTEFGAKWGGVLVVDVAAGDVLAWAQFPFFNPNSYNQYRPSEYRNRLAQDALEPGSTFKPFLIASALQEGVVTRDTTFNCENGLWKSRYITIRDDSRPKQNIQSVAKILANSSNIGCGKIGLELGAVKYQRYLSRLGFGERTSVQLAESRGILRPAREWSEADLISSSFGQSLSVTVLQMAQAYLTLANEGVYKPLRIVLTDDVGGGDQRIFSKNTTREVLSMMREVVDEGTGKRAAIPGVSVAGKTGTSEKVALYYQDLAEGNDRGMQYVVSYGGYAPADDPQYALLVFYDEPQIGGASGGTQAGPIFAAIMEEVLPYLGVDPQYTESEYENLSATAPNVIGMTMAEAKSHLEEQGFSGTVVGDAEEDALVSVQVPSPGASIPKEGMVALYTEEPDPETYVEVPRFIGYDIDTCRYLAGLADVQVLVVGDGDSGYAQSQDIAEGSKVKRGSVIRISFVSSGGVEAAGNTSTNSEE